MGLKNIVLIALVGLAAVGFLSVWNMAKPGGSGSKEGFKATTTDDDIDYYVAVSDAMKRNGNSEPTASEVRRTVAEARKKSVKVKDVDTFVKSKGGRLPVKEGMDTAVPDAKDPKEPKDPKDPKEGGESRASGDSREVEDKTPARPPTRKVKKAQQPPALSSAVADRLTKELNTIADRIDDLVEEINKYTQQPMDQPVQATVSSTEAFANFSSW